MSAQPPPPPPPSAGGLSQMHILEASHHTQEPKPETRPSSSESLVGAGGVAPAPATSMSTTHGGHSSNALLAGNAGLSAAAGGAVPSARVSRTSRHSPTTKLAGSVSGPSSPTTKGGGEQQQQPGFTRKANHWYHFPSAGSKPKGRIGHTLISNGDKAYVYGGTNDSVNSSSAVYFGDLHAYDINKKSWEEIPLQGAVQKARAFHTAVFYNNMMWVFGGCNGRGRFNKLYSIDRYGNTQLMSPVSTPPSSRYCHSAVVYQDRMYVFAGKSGGRNSNCRLSDLTYYDFRRNDWQVCPQHGTIPQSRSAHACFVYGNSMLVFGGRNSDGECCEDLHEYNFSASMWRSIDLDCAAFGRARHSITLHNNRIIVFGGWNGKKKLNDLFFFSLDTFHFENPDGAEEPPSRRECHTATVIDNTMIVFGGRFHGEFMTDVSELDLSPKSLKDNCRDWLLESLANFEDPAQELPHLLVKYFKETQSNRKRLFAKEGNGIAPLGHPRLAGAGIRPQGPQPMMGGGVAYGGGGSPLLAMGGGAAAAFQHQLWGGGTPQPDPVLGGSPPSTGGGGGANDPSPGFMMPSSGGQGGQQPQFPSNIPPQQGGGGVPFPNIHQQQHQPATMPPQPPGPVPSVVGTGTNLPPPYLLPMQQQQLGGAAGGIPHPPQILMTPQQLQQHQQQQQQQTYQLHQLPPTNQPGGGRPRPPGGPPHLQ